MKRLTKKVLLIGWDAADWKFLSPLMDEGLMPTLQNLVENGTKGRLTTLDPPLSPTLWTSIATGKRPYKHGIHGFTEPDPSGKNIRPINITNRKVKAIWNILTQHGLKTHVVGWWPSHPAEPINGIMVSNFFQQAGSKKGKDWPLKKGVIHPEHLQETFVQLRVHPFELTGTILQHFVPEAYKVNQSRDRRLHNIAKVTADCSTIHSAATYIMEHEEWDFMAVYYDAIDHYCHGFMKYHPPRREHVSESDYQLYKEVIRSACRYHDMMLARLLELAGEDVTILLMSDHGFHPGKNRPVHIPDEPSGPAIEHSPYGIIAMKGPGIKKDELIFGANLLDITPTLLTLFGLPVAEDMDGKVLVHAFEEIPKVDTIRSWENIKGPDGTHPKGFQQSPEEMEEELQQLIELGYIEDPGDDRELAVKRTINENNYYLARSYVSGGELEAALKLLEKLVEENPKVLRYAHRLSHVYQRLGKLKDARRVVNQIRTNINRESSQLDLLEANLLVSEDRPKKALELFEKIQQEAGDLPQINLRVGYSYYLLNKYDKAEMAFKKELEIDPEAERAYHYLGLTYFRTLKYEKAAEAFLDSIALSYYHPFAHFYLGETLMAMERFEDAVNAFETTLKLAPGMNHARQQLIAIYTNHLQQPGKALRYKQSFEEKLLGEITIVSGLPRSGTSMAMQMLEAGGITVFTDKEREADASNPKGYYEHEIVKSLAKNKRWLPKAKDKAVKVIAQLLKHLPMNFRYKVIFMERDIYEVVQSQQNMLIRNGKKVDNKVLPVNLINSYQKTLKEVKAWAENQPNVEMLYLQHQEVLETPFYQAMLINDFLDGQVRPEEMVKVVDPALYRERKSEKADINS